MNCCDDLFLAWFCSYDFDTLSVMILDVVSNQIHIFKSYQNHLRLTETNPEFGILEGFRCNNLKLRVAFCCSFQVSGCPFTAPAKITTMFPAYFPNVSPLYHQYFHITR